MAPTTATHDLDGLNKARRLYHQLGDDTNNEALTRLENKFKRGNRLTAIARKTAAGKRLNYSTPTPGTILLQEEDSRRGILITDNNTSVRFTLNVGQKTVGEIPFDRARYDFRSEINLLNRLIIQWMLKGNLPKEATGKETI